MMKHFIKTFLMILGVNMVFTTILGLLNEFNIFSYVLGICAMGVTDVLMELRYR